ncbi:Fungal specific transcription factor domain-containing protein isoform 2 [Cladophialophora immunda]|nr:Fungal specific transcription factor domain-containing protein isoform 1 [Cladophialophora immunda]OQV09017.1 Fungal specific transcription factor domain-containing protein isoform 2 [Cladophialophora immunda]
MSLEAKEASTASGSNAADRVVKKRASQACHHCRTRKVKCDLVKSGVPCHNCSSDGIECVILESRRSRKYRLQKRQASRPVALPAISQAQPKTTSEPPATSSQLPGGSPDAAPALEVAGPGQSNHVHPLVPRNFQTALVVPRNDSQGPPTQAGTASNASVVGAVTTDLPPYIRPSRPDIRQDDLEFLRRRGALSLPFGELHDQLIRSFVLYVHPFMPIVDLEDFLGALDDKDGSPKISLVVFQAILFSGTAFVELPLLQEAGYESRRAARADFYQKVKLLYDFDWDTDRIALIQALLLLNYWYVSENDQKDPWHWLGVCISLATSIGLNQPFTHAQKDPKTRALWRRIWWSCVHRDRIISISMRRPMRIKDEDIRLPPLRLDDFETGPIRSAILSLQGNAFLTDRYVRSMLADMYIAKLKLLLFIGQILKHFYHLRGFGGSTAESTMLYTPRRSEVNGKQYLDLQHDLDQWYRELPPSCWLVTSSSSVDLDPSTADSLLMHRSTLRMLYLMASEALNRPQSLSKRPSGSENSPTSKVKEAAEKIAEMTESLQERDLVRFLPPLSVSFMLLALASFLVDIKTKGQNVGALPGHQFHVCIRALLRLREIWPIADAACFLIGQMITKHQVGKVSTPGAQPAPMDASNAPSNVWRPPEMPQENTPAIPQFEQIPGAEMPFSSADISEPAPFGTQPEVVSTTSQGFVIPYNWSDEDFEGDYGVMVEAHALNMDLAMPDAEVLGFFGNGMFDFEPSPHHDQAGQDGMSYASQRPSVCEAWIPTVANQYMDAFRTPRSI